MSRRASLLNAFTKGVIDPALSERIDLEHYYNGLESGLNVEVFPQGGFRRRPGTTKKSRLRRRLQPLALTAGMVTAANGGTAASLVDQNPATRFVTSAVSGATFVLAELDLGAPRAICFADLYGYACTTGRYPRSIAVEYWNGSAWIAFAPDTTRARRGMTSGQNVEVLKSDNISSKGADERKALFQAPFDGKITRIQTRIDGPVNANTTVTLRIDDIAVTGGVVTITAAGSTAGDIDFAVPTGLNSFVADQEISAKVGGTSTLVGTLDIELTIEETQATRSRRWGLPPGQSVTAQLWRIVAYNAAGAGAIGIDGFRLWSEKRQVSPVRGFSHARSLDTIYEMMLTDRNLDVFRDGAWLTAVPVHVDAAQVREVTPTSSLDTAILYHENVQTQRLSRQGSHDEWNGEGARFFSVPKLSPGTAFAGDQDEIQDVRLTGIVAGDDFVLWLGSAVTVPINWDVATLAADVKTALLTLGVPSDLTVTLLDGDPGFRLSFAGNAGARRWPVVHAVVLDVDDIETATTVVQQGLDAEGPLFGETTGWPRCGVVYQERHIVGGPRGAPLTYAVSKFGSAYDFDDDGDPLTADLGFYGTLNSDHQETIQRITVGRHLMFFTDAGEWFAEARTIDATQPFNVNLGTRVGIRRGVPVAFIDGSLLFIQDGGKVMRDLLFSDVEVSYTADPLSLLAPHLLTDVVDIGARSQRSTDEGNHLLLVNADGTIAFMALLKSQKVVAMAPWATEGRYVAAFGDVSRRMWLVAERSSIVNGADNYLELLDDTHTLDAAVIYDRGGAPSDLLEGLEHVEGKDVWAWSDGDLVGPFLCEDGAVQFSLTATEVIAGLFPVLRARLPTLREKLQNGYPWRAPARVYETEIAMAATGQMDIAVNGGPFRPVPLTAEAGLPLEAASAAPRDTSGTAVAAPGEKLERLLKAITMVPGTGEFAYGTTVVTKTPTGGGSIYENMHNADGETDIAMSLGQARRALPNLDRVSLFVSWFGSDLRAGQCTVKPKVDQLAAAATWSPYDWAVAGLTRATADRVSLDGSGRPNYGGTPADRSVIEGIEELKRQGRKVTLTPFMVMDITAAMALPSPYGGTQGAFPWRGRITCDPAPSQPSTVDLTATAASQVAAFMGTVEAADYAVAAGVITYSGPAEWSYSRFILHHAALAKAAGGVDTFVIGSEMRGLTWVRSALGVYPFVTALVALAAEVKALLGADTKVTYAADWTELSAHQTGVPGECFFHLDPLWASASIDGIGVDAYWPLADWRAGTAHLDYIAGTRTVYDRAYLRSNIFGGEAFVWYYADQTARDAQVRTPITDGAYGKPWVWRQKDVLSWWKNQHFNRPAGVESGTPTAWVPQSKPVWLMETGCAAVDRGANQPSAHYDPRSSESGLPWYSRGHRDDEMQRAYLEALLSFFTPGVDGFDAACNPVSQITGKRMVEPEMIAAYTWDARFHPAFPRLLEVWSDGTLWAAGHWLTGRLAETTGIAGVAVGTSETLPMRDRLVTGNVRMTNLLGWSRHPTIEISQSMPAPLEIKAIRYEVAYG